LHIADQLVSTEPHAAISRCASMARRQNPALAGAGGEDPRRRVAPEFATPRLARVVEQELDSSGAAS